LGGAGELRRREQRALPPRAGEQKAPCLRRKGAREVDGDGYGGALCRGGALAASPGDDGDWRVWRRP